jgi:hypothetical protein
MGGTSDSPFAAADGSAAARAPAEGKTTTTPSTIPPEAPFEGNSSTGAPVNPAAMQTFTDDGFAGNPNAAAACATVVG